MPSVAVLLPVCGGDNPGYFEQSLLSVINQDYPCENIFLHVAVDGTIPRSLMCLLDKYAGYIYRIYVNNGPGGLANNLNNAIAQLDYFDYVARQDADDISCKNRLTNQVAYMESHKDIGILGSSIFEFEGDDRTKFKVRRYPKKSDVIKSIAKASPLAHPSVIFRYTDMKTLGAYPLSGMNEDLAMWFMAISKGVQVDNMDDPLVWFRVTKSTATRRGYKKALGEFSIYFKGIRDLGLPARCMVYPVLRLIYRFLPGWVRSFVFSMAGLRNRVLR